MHLVAPRLELAMPRLTLRLPEAPKTASPLDQADNNTGDLQHDAKAEVTAVQQAFRDRTAKEAARRTAATDSEYWCCLCFQSREQVEAFIAATGWSSPEAKYIDGQAVARKLGIVLPNAPEYRDVRIDNDWSNLAL